MQLIKQETKIINMYVIFFILVANALLNAVTFWVLNYVNLFTNNLKDNKNVAKLLLGAVGSGFWCFDRGAVGFVSRLHWQFGLALLAAVFRHSYPCFFKNSFLNSDTFPENLLSNQIA